MPKTDKRQGMINDIRLEDPALEALLARRAELEPLAAEIRQNAADIKTAMIERHERAINSDRDGQHSGYAVCGPYRWRPRRTHVEAQTVTKAVVTKEGYKWEKLEVFEMALNSGGVE